MFDITFQIGSTPASEPTVSPTRYPESSSSSVGVSTAITDSSDTSSLSEQSISTDNLSTNHTAEQDRDINERGLSFS